MKTYKLVKIYNTLNLSRKAKLSVLISEQAALAIVTTFSEILSFFWLIAFKTKFCKVKQYLFPLFQGVPHRYMLTKGRRDYQMPSK